MDATLHFRTVDGYFIFSFEGQVTYHDYIVAPIPYNGYSWDMLYFDDRIYGPSHSMDAQPWPMLSQDGFGVATAGVERGASSYRGQWKDGQRHGFGLLNYSNGDVYYGQWRWNQKEGHGIMNYKHDGYSYDGEWMSNHTCGQGTVTTSTGEVLTGIWEKNKLGSGPGVLTMTNGDRIEGDFHMGQVYGETKVFSPEAGTSYDIYFEDAWTPTDGRMDSSFTYDCFVDDEGDECFGGNCDCVFKVGNWFTRVRCMTEPGSSPGHVFCWEPPTFDALTGQWQRGARI
jgi:hypothetical protein